MVAESMNGRVSDIQAPMNSTSSISYDRVEHAQQRAVFDDEATKGIRGSSELSQLFFSKLNIDALQDGIRYSVYQKTCQKHIIGRQSEDELKVIMRSIFLQYAQNLPYNVVEQVRELNSRVLEYAVNTIVHELDMYSGYRKDLASLPMPLERGQNSSVAGTKVNEFKSFM